MALLIGHFRKGEASCIMPRSILKCWRNLISNEFSSNMKKYQTITAWVARIVAAIIMLQTLYFKFTGAEESRFIFSQLGAEPWGRIGSGVIELIASVLILIPRTSVYGALLGLGAMSGAILSHLTILGIEIQNDGGQLFIYGLLVFICCFYLVWADRKKLPFLLRASG